MPIRIANLTWVTGATGSTSQYVGHNNGIVAYVSNMTGWASAAGNSTFALRGAAVSGTSHVSIPGASVTTETGGAMYILSTAAGVPFISIGFGSITSGAGTMTLMVQNDNY